MKILIIGASRGTGLEAVKIALEHGHTVTAFSRSAQNLGIQSNNLIKFEGDFHQIDSVYQSVNGQDAVIITASASRLREFKEKRTFFSAGTGNVINAMKEYGVKRLVILSAIGVGESVRLKGPIIKKLLISFLMKAPFDDHGLQEKMVKESGLEWVIVRPHRLINAPARKNYIVKTEIGQVPGTISRADVADFMVKAAQVDTWIGKAVQIGG